ncbi:MAG TPA: FxsB family cyclophane-forming radical SAM/SPASM peptide maturase [Micromonosporaceae bacterium]
MLKVHSRCDLACDHCYVYEHADQSWRGRPRAMSVEIADVVAARIAEHAQAHRLGTVTIVLHGGEPLLLGHDGLRAIMTSLRERITPVTRLNLRMQTNGVLLTRQLCDLLVEYDVRVGVSLDGDQSANDRHRRFANGASSHDRVLRALGLLRERAYRRQYAGILCTIDVHNDPVAVYDALAEQEPPRIDFLLPHATWDQPPPRPGPEPTPYAQWLLRVHDRWAGQGRPMAIRLFDALRSTGRGGPSGSEWVGLDPADLVVVETDGAWEQVDSLKITFDGAPATGLSVFTHSVDQVAALPAIVQRQVGLAGLAPTCRACAVVQQCGGGLFAHRYRQGSGFANPSVYCADLMELIVSLNSRSAAAPSTPSRDGRGLPSTLIEQVGSGRAEPAAIDYLAQTQLAIGRAVSVAVGEQGSPMARSGLDLLRRLDRDCPDAVGTVLSHPYLRVWAVQALREARLGRLDSTNYLACVAAAAAMLGGQSVTVPVPVADGVIHLPSLGSVTVPGRPSGQANLTISAGTLTVEAGGAPITIELTGHPNWQPARWISVDGISVLLEDLDPYRDCHDWKAEGRLPENQVRGWQAMVEAAWRTIGEDAPAQIPALRRVLRSLTALEVDPTGLLRSSTARHAFGSIGAALAPGESLAVMLVHEAQHTILGALLDLCDLFDRDDRSQLTVAWRTDPRPIEGVLQGTFAHLAVADIWRSRAERAGAGSAADATFRQYCDWTGAAIDTMLASGALTAAGSRFVTSMAATMTTWS